MKETHKKIIVITSLILSAIFLYGNRPPEKILLGRDEENQFLKHPKSWSEITDGVLDGLFVGYTPINPNEEGGGFYPLATPRFCLYLSQAAFRQIRTDWLWRS